MKPPESRNYIDSLPNELLLHIFKLVYASVHPIAPPDWQPRLDSDRNSDKDGSAGSSESEDESSTSAQSEADSFDDQGLDSLNAHPENAEEDSETGSRRIKTLKEFALAVLEEVANEHDWDESGDNVLVPSAFPRALAGVCHRWRSLTVSVPEFWTRIVIPMDSPEPLYAFSRHIERMKVHQDLESIVIISGAHCHATGPGSEDKLNPDSKRQGITSRLVEIIQAIGPHLQNLRCFSADVPSPADTTSILQAFTTFHTGGLFDLRSLRLVNHSRTPIVPLQITSIPVDTPRPFGFFWLRNLTLSGNVFVQLLRNGKWEDAMRDHALDSLKILSLRPEDGDSDTAVGTPFNVFDLFDGIYGLFQRVRYITLTDVDLASTNSHPLWDPDDEYPDWKTEHVHFTSCTVKVIEGYSIYSPHGNQSLTFESCDLHELEYSIPETPCLTLKNLDAGSLIVAIQKNDAVMTTFKDCPELTDEIILALASEIPDSCFLEQPRLTSLHFHGCPGVSEEALKTVVSVRQKRRESRELMAPVALTYLRDEEDCSDAPPLKSLALSGENGRCLSKEMRAWFQENLEEFVEI